MIHTATRRFHFSAGHRVYGHESVCGNLHGHNYIVFVTARAALDDLGRVVDFGVLKERIDPWIQKHWDHGMILWQHDPAVVQWKAGGPFSDQKHYLLDRNPTAENLAAVLHAQCHQLLPTSVFVTRVRVWETPNCFADAMP